MEILQLVGFGDFNADGSGKLYISPDTVKTHLG
jgi:DNA-binding CsgD family transcriptional regulator